MHTKIAHLIFGSAEAYSGIRKARYELIRSSEGLGDYRIWGGGGRYGHQNSVNMACELYVRQVYGEVMHTN